jgi:hypothetical protein
MNNPSDSIASDRTVISKDALEKTPLGKNRHIRIEPLESRIAPATVTITVNTLSGHDVTGKITLADAIATADASPGNTTIINFAPHLKGTINLASPLDISSSVTINGAGIVLNGGGKVEDLSITGGLDVALNGLKITGGLLVGGTNGGAGGGLYIADTGGTVTLSQCTVSGNHVIGGKGASATNGNTGSNGYNAAGGGIAILSGTVNILNSTISGNTATGGAGGTGGYAGGSAQGGGIYYVGTLSLTNTHITGNTVTGGAGTAGIHGVAYSAAVSGPVAPTNGGSGGSAYGGGIANVDGSVTIQNTGRNISVISGNTVKAGAGADGGGAYNGTNGANFHVTAGTAYSAYAGGYGSVGGYGGNGGNAGGGAVSSAGGSVKIVSSTISGNTVSAGAGGSGANGGAGGKGGNGGMYMGSTYYGYAGGNGGNGGNAGAAGIAAGGGLFSKDALTIQASTISGNIVKAAAPGKAGTAGPHGANGTLYQGGGGGPSNGTAGSPASPTPSTGGGFYFNGTTLSVTVSTFAKNTAQDGGGGHIANSTTASIYNSTFALNSATISGGGLNIASGNTGTVNLVSNIIAQNTLTNLAGTAGGLNADNITSGLAVAKLLAVHSGGPTQTLLPLASLTKVTNNSTSNPAGLTADQNGVTFGSTIEIGAVQTPA